MKNQKLKSGVIFTPPKTRDTNLRIDNLTSLI
jgi:hypothetical protein